MYVQAFCLQKWPMVLQFCKCGCFIVFYWSIRLYIILLFSGYGLLVFKNKLTPDMDSWLWICQFFKFGLPHWPWVNVQCQILKIPNTSCMCWGIWCYPFSSNYACSYPGQKTHITWQLWWISTFNPQAHFSNHDDVRRNSSQLIDKTTKKEKELHNKNWQPFYGKEHDAWHTYIPADKASFTCLSRTPPTSLQICHALMTKTWMVKNNRNSRWELLAHASFQLFCHETRMCGRHGLCLLLHISDRYSFLSGEGKQRRRHKHMVSQLRLLLWQLL